MSKHLINSKKKKKTNLELHTNGASCIFTLECTFCHLCNVLLTLHAGN